jgi:hypothetical protein
MQAGEFLVTPTLEQKPFNSFETAHDKTLGNYIAIALVDQEVGLKLGSTFASSHAVYPVTSATVTPSNIVATLTALAKQGRAYFINKDISGIHDATTNYQDPDAYGNKAGGKSVDLYQGMVNITTDKWTANKGFFALLRNNKPFDIFLFTNNSVTQLNYAEHGVVYQNIVQQAYNRDQHIRGGWSIAYRVTDSLASDVQPSVGVTLANILAPIFFTFAAPTVGGTGLTTTANDGKNYQYAKTLAGAGTLVFALNPADSGVEIGCFKTDGSSLPADYGTYDAIAKTLTLPATMTAGTYEYAVVAINGVGVKGEIRLKVKVQ